MCIFEYNFDNCSCSLYIIYVTIGIFRILFPMFVEKITNNFEKMVLLRGNLPTFVSLNLLIRLFICV